MRPAFEAAAALPWAIWQPALQTILEIAGDQSPAVENLRLWKAAGEAEALAGRQGLPLAGSRSVTLRDGVAVLPIVGPIFRRANLMTDFSGAVSLEMVAQDFAAALEAPQVKAIMLAIDSPGGEANGIAEFADMVRAAAKPVTAYVGGNGASAAYWIAAAAHETVAARTAWLGSIGVVMAYRDSSARDERAGVRTVEFVSSQSPNKRLDINSDAGRAAIQARVDRLAAEFVAAVAAFRGVDEQAVLERFGAGDVLLGADAVAAGMADRLGSFESVLAGLAGQTAATGRTVAAGWQRSTAQGASGMTDTTTAAQPAAETQPAITLDLVKASHPAIAAALRAEGATAERARILGIQAAALPGHDALVAKLVADGVEVGAAAQAILAAEKEKGPRVLEALRAAEPKETPQPAAAPLADSRNRDPLAEDGRPLKDRAAAKWEADSAIRAEFGTFGAYLGFLEVEAANKARRG